MTESMFHTRSISLHGARTGDGPLVVFLHGITANWAVWKPVTDLLGNDWTCVSVSQRGHGFSEHPNSGYDAAHYADDVCALIESLDLGRALVVGHSLGARNAVVAAAARPDLIGGVLSVDFVSDIERSALDRLASRVSFGNKPFESLDEVRTYLAQRYPRLPADAVDRRAINGYQRSDGAFRPLANGDAMVATAAGLYESYEDSYARVTVPTIAIRGIDSTLVPQADFDRAAALRPDIRHEVIAGVDHYIPEENPGVIAQLVLELQTLCKNKLFAQTSPTDR